MEPKLNCVMLIDDDELANAMHKAAIDELDCSYVIRKKSVKSGINYLINSASSKNLLPFPEIIFVDIYMPDLSGWDFVKYYNEIKIMLPNKSAIYMLSDYILFADAFRVSNSPDLAGIYEKPLTAELIEKIFDQFYFRI